MESKARTARYVFRPAAVDILERRDVPSAGAASADLRNLSATITGEAHPAPIEATSPGGQQVDFAGSGKDAAGRRVELSGSLVNDAPRAGSTSSPGTRGWGTLTTRRGRYHFALDGPRSDLDAPSGLSNVEFRLSRSRPRPARVGAARPSPAPVAMGSMQIHRQPGSDGRQEFTATLVVNGRENRG